MRKIKWLQIIVVILLMNFMTTACSIKQENLGENQLHVAAASNLRFAFEEIGSIFEEISGVKIVFQFGSSGNLAQQITNGAPIDLFVSANKEFVEDLIKNGHVLEDTKALFAIGRIVLAVNKNVKVKVTSLEDLLLDEIEYISIANPNHAPYGLAAKEALQSIGIWEFLEEKLVYGENVSQALQFIETGNAPVGIIALSIAKVEELEYILIDEETHNPLEQILGVVSSSNNKELAKEFALFVNSPLGREIMEKHGFSLP